MIIIDCILLIMYVILLGCVLYSINKFQIDKLKKNSKPINRVHFYVARDMDGTLYLYIGKPVRTIDEFLACNYGKAIISSKYFSKYGLDENDYDNLKWKDEPVEVFLNMEN